MKLFKLLNDEVAVSHKSRERHPSEVRTAIRRLVEGNHLRDDKSQVELKSNTFLKYITKEGIGNSILHGGIRKRITETTFLDIEGEFTVSHY